ncbi:unnamed protein product, partial [Cyprideis torosa]
MGVSVSNLLQAAAQGEQGNQNGARKWNGRHRCNHSEYGQRIQDQRLHLHSAKAKTYLKRRYLFEYCAQCLSPRAKKTTSSTRPTPSTTSSSCSGTIIYPLWPSFEPSDCPPRYSIYEEHPPSYDEATKCYIADIESCSEEDSRQIRPEEEKSNVITTLEAWKNIPNDLTVKSIDHFLPSILSVAGEDPSTITCEDANYSIWNVSRNSNVLHFNWMEVANRLQMERTSTHLGDDVDDRNGERDKKKWQKRMKRTQKKLQGHVPPSPSSLVYATAMVAGQIVGHPDAARSEGEQEPVPSAFRIAALKFCRRRRTIAGLQRSLSIRPLVLPGFFRVVFSPPRRIRGQIISAIADHELLSGSSPFTLSPPFLPLGIQTEEVRKILDLRVLLGGVVLFRVVQDKSRHQIGRVFRFCGSGGPGHGIFRTRLLEEAEVRQKSEHGRVHAGGTHKANDLRLKNIFSTQEDFDFVDIPKEMFLDPLKSAELRASTELLMDDGVKSSVWKSSSSDCSSERSLQRSIRFSSDYAGAGRLRTKRPQHRKPQGKTETGKQN